ncbi:MAG: outer membrane beta-barrel family protein [Cruoricaptor ignavus]|nr:outer membrane beta-barrel family protein [Cruoricaptor ignavus]
MNKIIYFYFIIFSSLITGQEKINIDTSDLQKEIEVINLTAKKKLIERKVDRLVYNVENSVAAQGMDAIDALSNTPMLKVDENGGISIVGKSGVSVMVNDRMLNLSGNELVNYLKAMRSDNIAKIEVITTPPAKYEAQGNSGIINIILKKNTNLGFSGNFSSSLTARSWFGGASNITLNYQSEKLISSLKLRHYDNMYHVTERYKIDGHNSSESNDIRKDFGNGYGANISLDYKINKKSSVGAIYDIGFTNSNMDINSNMINKLGNMVTNDFQIYTENRGKRNAHTLNLYYDLKLGSTGKKMSIASNYYSYIPDTNVDFTAHDRNSNTHNIVKNTSVTDYKIYSAQLDFTLPYNFINIETGAKIVKFENGSDVGYFDFNIDNYIQDLSKSNIFDYNENNYAVYISGSKDFNEKWTGKAGFRYELSEIDAFSQTLNQKTKYDYGKLFPTLYISYKPNKNNVVSLNYSKRISRPGFRTLNPFRWYSGPYKYSTGNPLLQPSYSHNLELAYVWKNSLSFTLGYQKMLDGYGQIAGFDDGIIINTYKNYFDADYFDANINYSNDLFKWWQTSITLNANYSVADARFGGIGQKGYSFYYSTQNTFSLNSQKTSSLILNYRKSSNYKDDNGYYYGQGNLTLGYRVSLMDKNLQILISANDILKQQKSRGEIYFNDNTQYFNNYYDARSIRASITYKFGNKKINVNQKNIQFKETSRAN